MPLEHAPRCTYIKITGHPCQSPALKGKNFCYFHQRVHRHVALPYQSNLEPQFVLDNEESIQYALMETLTAIVRGTMDHKTAALVLRGLSIAVKNCHQNNVCFDYDQHEIVREVPDYAHQYLLEHPEYGPPITADEVSAIHGESFKNELQRAAEAAVDAQPASSSALPAPAPAPDPTDRRPPASDRSDASATPSLPAATVSPSASTPLSTRQSQPWRELRRLQSSFEGARRGNLKDLKTCFHLANLFPTRPK